MVDMDATVQRIDALLAQRRFAHVVTFGAEMAMYARRNLAYRAVVNEADLVIPDTIGIVHAARMLGCSVAGRVPGVELVERLCAGAAASGVPVFLLGGQSDVVERANRMLRERYPALQVVGTHHGFFEAAQDGAVAEAVRSSGARLVFVALGFPKQELWIRTHAGKLSSAVCVGVGGSFDVLSGAKARAPVAMQRLGLEWLYRLVREPRRFGRQLALPAFAALVAWQAVRQRWQPTHGARSGQ
jgi:N-acetylglucosaminyldiphosphoundecaprenol N-acetyl-beta-D-mannosaminyltransferase